MGSIKQFSKYFVFRANNRSLIEGRVRVVYALPKEHKVIAIYPVTFQKRLVHDLECSICQRVSEKQLIVVYNKDA